MLHHEPSRLLLLTCDTTAKGQRLDLAGEKRAIQEGLGGGHRLILDAYEQAKKSDLQRLLADHHPAILHISSHGTLIGGIALCDEDGAPSSVPAQTVAAAVAAQATSIKLVVLNACYSEGLAERLREIGVEVVIGVTGSVPDENSLRFSRGLYRSLAAGKSIREAFAVGCTEASLDQATGGDFFRLIERTEGSADRTVVVEEDNTPEALFLLLLDVYTTPDQERQAVQGLSGVIPHRTFRLSGESCPQLENGQGQDTLDWEQVAAAAAALVRRARAADLAMPSRVRYVISGFAPHAVYALVGQLLASWNTPISFVHFDRRNKKLSCLDARRPGRAAAFLERRDLTESSAMRRGAVGVYIHVNLGYKDHSNAAALDHLHQQGDWVAMESLVSLQDTLSADNIHACQRDLVRYFTELKQRYPYSDRIILYTNTPAPVALLACRAINTNLYRVDTTIFTPAGYRIVLSLPWTLQ